MENDDAMTAVQRELQRELQETKRELEALRSGIRERLGLSTLPAGDDGEAAGLPTDEVLLGAITRLRTIVTAYEAPVEAEGSPWQEIDVLIVGGRKIQALQAMRAEFGDSLPEALERLGARYEKLRREKPEAFAATADTYWDGFYS